jgi:outer membrane protein TolC
LPAEIDAGLPLQLIERRPDIRAQERILAAATARVGVATGALFPHIALSGSIGAQFPTIGTEGGTHIWSFGPSAYWPLLDFGSLDALVDIADLNTRQQTAIYRRTVLNAVREVDQSVTAFAAQQDRVENLLDALAQSQRAVSLAKERYDRGLTDFLNVADAERQHYALEAQVIIAQQTAADDFVAVCRSLGGGWEDYRHTAPVRLPHPALLAMFERLGVPAPQQELPQ